MDVHDAAAWDNRIIIPLTLVAVFAILALLLRVPIVAFARIGFAVAFGVLLDTLVVRSALITALNLDLGPRMWWPSRLATTPGSTIGVITGRVRGPGGGARTAVLTLLTPGGDQVDRTRTGAGAR